MKKLFFILSATAIVVLIALISSSVAAERIYGSMTFYSLPDDGEIQNWEYVGIGGKTYGDVRNATEGKEIYDDSDFNCFGQDFAAGVPGHAWDILIYRFFLFFDTQRLPDDVTIDSAYLYLYGKNIHISEGHHFDIWVQHSSSSTTPHRPLQLGDFYYKYYQSSPNGIEKFNSKKFKKDCYNVLRLNSQGISWINSKGITHFCLRSSRDVKEIDPGMADEYISVYSYESGGKCPKLVVDFSFNADIEIEGDSEVYRGREVTYEAVTSIPNSFEVEEYEWQIDTEKLNEKGDRITYTFEESGEHRISLKVKIKCKDSEWYKWVGPIEKTVNAKESPPEIESVSPERGKVRKDITFTIKGEDKNLDDVRFIIDWGDGKETTTSYFKPNNDGIFKCQITHKYLISGTYTIEVTPEDSTGRKGDPYTLTFTAGRKNNKVEEDFFYRHNVYYNFKHSNFLTFIERIILTKLFLQILYR